MSRRRLDQELVRRGLAESRAAGQALIAEGRVLVGGSLALKASRLTDTGDAITMQGDPPRFVSRGGEKLDAALDRFAVPIAGRSVIDVGASTGGFTDCCLQRGARSVVALDVGHGQLHERIRHDERVTVLERCNVRTVTDPDAVGGPADVVVVDVSFISLRAIADKLAAFTAPDGDLVALVKPQFEAGKAEADRGRGVIKDPEVWRRVLVEVGDTMGHHGLAIMDLMPSPIHGSSGNTEFLLHARHELPDVGAPELADLVDDAVAAAPAPKRGES